MLGFLQRQPLLEEETVAWLFDVYAWALEQFGAQLFYEHTRLVVPTNEFFPGRAASPDEMARLMFLRVKEYAGLGHWPCRLINAHAYQPIEHPAMALQGPLRRAGGEVPDGVPSAQRLPVVYDPAMVNNPEAMIATFAQMLGHHLGSLAPKPPPVPRETWAGVVEVLGTFMGFGIMFANTTVKVQKSSCGACQGTVAEREVFLSSYDNAYALAIFAVLKGIPDKAVTRHLKSSLRGFYRRAVKDVRGRRDLLARLQGISDGPALAAPA